MTPLSANLGFLWNDRPLPDAIRAAKAAGFDAVECHWPYAHDADAVKAALEETGLAMLGINTVKGPRESDFGLAAQPGREAEARRAIDEAFDYGTRVGASAVHVMAGLAGPDEMASMASFVTNLGHACDWAHDTGMKVLIEPLNPYDNPGYFLIGFDKAREVVDAVGRDELKIMFDCYHLQITDGDLLRRFRDNRAVVGHVQFAGVPDRGEPDHGEVAYDRLLPAIADAGYSGAFGAEYRPSGRTDATLKWMTAFR
ncbi:hydroxypyruvate isomerase, putative [Fulvimarina pelagi HTCC2506]|uniref:Hydroxypyruvate isomerase, putative n=1 Tax=Fulvimarina pelagi HTCC2506 TaxID=314231 RepID=Q0G1P7_9HYPH|nr:TIM barrel protein [Fulvimarina pelagi]EAU41034.1 hydroxypyruvate isomerase, putative [Fulvimarina pelagi HTCC2506]